MRAALPLAAVAIGVFADGGYSSTPRLAFGMFALAAALIALCLTRSWTVTRSPVVLVLGMLAFLGAVSAVWTLGPVERTLRWALVTAGFAGVAVAAGVAARRPRGPEAIAAGIAVIAVVAGALGLWAAATHDFPYAELTGGVWRPGGPFEYAPALALLQVSALPVLLAGMLAPSRVVAAAASGGLAVAAGVLALAGSRAALSMGIALAGAALLFPQATLRRPRRPVAAAIGLGAAAAVAFELGLGGGAWAASERSARALVALVVTLLTGLLWAGLRPRVDAGAGRGMPRRIPTVGLAAALAAVSVAAGLLAFGPSAGRTRGGGVLHDRADTWGAAVSTFADRPLAGAGADAFLAGSARHQEGESIVFAHDLPLELAAELGMAGLLLGVALYGASGGALWRDRGTTAAWLLGPASAAFLAASLIDWPWHLAGAGAVWAAATGALAAAERPPRNLRSPIESGRLVASGATSRRRQDP